MAEWPKYCRFWGDKPDEPVKDHAVLVIPADLGRELYEATKKIGTQDKGVLEALARYEREVSGAAENHTPDLDGPGAHRETSSGPADPEPFDVRQKARDRADEERIRRQER